MNNLLRAAKFAAEKHTEQKRKNVAGTPYINHPIEVAERLANIGGVEDEGLIIAALLHDTIEDTATTAEGIKREFGEQVMKWVLECSDDKSLAKAERKRLQIVNAAGKSEGAKMIKVSDTSCNLHSILEEPPVGWSVGRRLGYFEWAGKVFAGLKGANAKLDEGMEVVLDLGLQKLQAECESLFDEVPVESETRIFQQQVFTIGSMPVRCEYWGWDGIRAKSLVFRSVDVAQLDDNELRQFVNENSKIELGEDCTYSRDKNGFCFVNYDFETDDED